MALDTVETTLAKGVWTQITFADAEYMWSSNRPIRFVFGTTMPSSSVIGHPLKAWEPFSTMIDAGRFLYCCSNDEDAVVTVTKSW